MPKAQTIMKELQNTRDRLEDLIEESCLKIPVLSTKTGEYIRFRLHDDSGGLCIPCCDLDMHVSAEHAFDLGRWLIEMFEDDRKAEEPRNEFPDLLEDIFGYELKGVPNESYVKVVKALAEDLKRDIDEQVEYLLTISHSTPGAAELARLPK